MSKLFARWMFLALSVVAASYLTQRLGLGFRVDLSSVGQAMLFAIGVLVLGFLNATLGRIVKLLTLPLTCATLGLFALVVNALVLWLAAGLNLGFRIEGTTGQQFLAAFLGSLLISVVNGLLNGLLLADRDKDDDRDR
ncbi:MAG: phage holin family protein [Fimbriimonadaceae bacterium]